MRERMDEESSGKVEATIFIVSDELEVAAIWGYTLSQRGINMLHAMLTDEVIDYVSRAAPDLVVIDLHSSKEHEALELLRLLRAEITVPLLFFVPRMDEALVLEGYRCGADECAANPLSPPLFLAKVCAWLRRSHVIPAEALDVIEVDQMRFDPARRQLSDGLGGVISLTNLESRLLYLLMSNQGRTLETEYIVARVWGHYGNGDSILLKNAIYRLRRKLEPNPTQPRFIHTEPGIGYRFQVIS